MIKPKIAIIMYYRWNSDGRGKTSGGIYNNLGYDLQVFCSREVMFPKIRNEENAKIWNGIKKYMGNNIFLYLLNHIIFLFQSGLWLFQRCIEDKPKIIHIHNMPDYFMILSLIGKLFRIKIIWDIRDISPALWFSKKNSHSLTPSGKLFKFILFVQNLSGKLATYIICADIYQKEFLEENGLNSKRIEVFMNLPLEDKYMWIGPSKNENPYRFVYHGTITHRLGLDLAITAINQIKNEHNVLFDIIGEGDSYEELMLLIKDLDAEENIRIRREMIPNDQIPQWIAGASGAIIPNRKTYSTNNFMLPHKMLEYIRLGIPVIAPRLKIIETYLKDDQVIFFDPGNVNDLASAILKLIQCDRNQLAKNAYRFFDSHNYETNKNILKSMLN